MARKEVPLCYVDSSVFLDQVKDEKDPSQFDNITTRGEMAKAIFGQVKAGELLLATSPLVVAEVGFKNEDDPVKNEILESLMRLIYEPSTRWIDIERTVVELAIKEGPEWRDGRANPSSKKMGPNDAIHLASAIRLRAHYLLTSDGGYPVGQTIQGVQVAYAHPIGRQTLGI